MEDPRGYLRFEAQALWRESPGSPVREVIVSLGKRTLVLSDLEDRILGHWARDGLRPIRREGDTEIYALSADGGETLAIVDRDMIAAIAGSRPRPVGRQGLRRGGESVRIALVAALGAVMLAAIAGYAPRAIRAQTERLILPERATELSGGMLLMLMDEGARPCRNAGGERSLSRLGALLALPGETTAPIRVMSLGSGSIARLPDGTAILSRKILDSAGSVEELAGWTALALARAPVGTLVTALGPAGQLHYLLTREIGAAALGAATRAAQAPPSLDEVSAAKDRLETLGIPTGPFAAALIGGTSDPSDAHPSSQSLQTINWTAIRQICAAPGDS